MKQVGIEGKQKRKARSCSSASVEKLSFTGENFVSSPAPKHKKLRMSTSSARVPADGAKWPANVEAVFVHLMYTEVLRGNIYTTSFTPSVWKDIMNNLALQCGLAYNVKKLKAKHSRMKKLWRKIHELMVDETGVCWDEAINMPIASTQLWEQILERNPKYAELRHKRCPHYYKLGTIFSSRTATAYAARASTFTEPGAGSASATSRYVNEVDEGEPVPSPMHPQSSHTISSQHDLHDDILIQILEKIVDLNTTSQAVHVDKLNNAYSRVIEFLREIPNLTREQWVQALEFLENSTHREFFISMTQDERIQYLHYHLKW